MGAVTWRASLRQTKAKNRREINWDTTTHRYLKSLRFVTGCLQRWGVAHGGAGCHHPTYRREMRVLGRDRGMSLLLLYVTGNCGYVMLARFMSVCLRLHLCVAMQDVSRVTCEVELWKNVIYEVVPGIWMISSAPSFGEGLFTGRSRLMLFCGCVSSYSSPWFFCCLHCRSLFSWFPSSSKVRCIDQALTLDLTINEGRRYEHQRHV